MAFCKRKHPVQHVLVLIIILSTVKASLGAPVLAPNLTLCHIPLSLPDEEEPFSCCAPDFGQPAKWFNLTAAAEAAAAGKIRVRRPAHAMSDEDVARLSKAYAAMRALPFGDPRNYDQQANIHCAYCSACYQMGGSSTPLQVHGSWLFFAFHRWYIYFHERILAKLINDDTFYLPFWNYDHPDGMTVPRAYVDSSELRDDNREPACLPPATVFTDFYYYNESLRTHEEQMAANLATIYRQVIAAPDTPYRFYGQPYREGDGPQPGYGTVETQPHNSLHGWTGNQVNILAKDMGALYAAARDPIFYIHHANIDRLWEVWMRLGRDDIDDPDYLDSEFVFYDENAELVKVKVRDAYDIEKLGYVYEWVDNIWLNLSLVSLSNGVAANITSDTTLCKLGEPMLETCSLLVSRNFSSNNGGQQTLVLGGIEGDLSSPSLFNVYINLPSANVHTLPNCTEYVGRFSAMAQPLQAQVQNSSVLRSSARFGISQNIKDLKLEGEENLVLTIVPSTHQPLLPVSIKSVWIEYELLPSAHRKINSKTADKWVVSSDL
ncbi:hypothetical protein KP509_08G065000 [Ceratopteris richardii]|uniref:Tyrosinase copper-binding domain-containing protein n=1 Tax=Ceratopteris richardii TaxID=49495 RepID=A0A8T2UAP3_CERRI|nr:hypothetical protein KP509_08G065000 [Ceratopteris richardii]